MRVRAFGTRSLFVYKIWRKGIKESNGAWSKGRKVTLFSVYVLVIAGSAGRRYRSSIMNQNK